MSGGHTGHRTVSKLLTLAGKGSDNHNTLNYNDYCYALCEDGSSVTPISKKQWDSLVAIAGGSKLAYTSSTNLCVDSICREIAERNIAEASDDAGAA